MKSLFALVIAAITMTAFAQNKPLITSYTVNTGDSKVAWLGKKVTGQHNGHLKVKSGKLDVQGDVLTGGEIVVDINSLSVEDIKAADDAGKFVGHMKSDDFFAAEKFPEARLVIKNSKKTAKGLQVNGDLTIKGVTKPVTFLAQLAQQGNDLTGKTTLKVDRTKFDLKYGSGKFFKGLGDKMIHDEFTLTVDIVAEK